ncbi:hypothetical protein Pla52n_11220 [Stieleria varia]|uniref:EamA domain-containing protein n=2 Tax=Stieleria varia TaxID=2528005 RepID=A0A5C6BB91_9BACT|nr:hypothetical protein Pla52n_11220 [Stieleria varia]
MPLMASILFVLGLLLLKRATTAGISPWTVTFVANQWAGLIFSALWFLGGNTPTLQQLWQPAVIALLYIGGQVGTFVAITHGDVSIAAPMFGVKVIMVAVLLTIIGGVSLPLAIWIAAGLATAGIALVQWTGTGLGKNRLLGFTIAAAMAASTCFSFFDVLVQRWSPEFGVGRLVPIMFWFVAVFSIGFAPWIQRQKLRDPQLRKAVLGGGLLIAMQAFCIVFTISNFGDAAAVNVVYSMRGIWGVSLAWLIARRFGGAEADLGRSKMLTRLAGATLITIAVVLAVLSR